MSIPTERGFWQTLELPIIALAPMDGVTDAAYRLITARHGKSAVSITEFTAAEGIRAGAERLLLDFAYDEAERPVVAQLFGSDSDAFRIAAAVAAALGFDGIDINMGCPAKNITERGAGAALIRDPERAVVIIRATRAGIAEWANGKTLEEIGVVPHLIQLIEKARASHGLTNERRVIPVSVKTRIGYDSTVIEEWAKVLLGEDPAVITIHGRTLKQGYTGLADWEAIGRAAAIIKQTPTLVLGNGDVKSMTDAREKIATYGTHGALIGRASFGNPWLFAEREASIEERLMTAVEHARIFNALNEGKGFLRMRKHLLDYTRGFDGARELRQQLMRVTSLAEVEALLIH